MTQVPHSDLERSIPLLVQREPAQPPGLPPAVPRGLVLITAATALSAALLLLMLHPDTGRVVPVSAAYGALALLALGGSRLADALQERVLIGVMALALLCMGGAALQLGWGLSMPAMAVIPLLVCVATAVAGANRGLPLALLAALLLAALAWHDGQRRGPGAGLPGPDPALLLAADLLALGAAAAAGLLLARLVRHAVQAAHKRELRFQRLLSLAADAYWEIDQHFHLVAAGETRHGQRQLTTAAGLGKPPWELPRFAADAETLDLLMADLGSRTPFRDLPISWRTSDGTLRHYLVSGEPRIDAAGLFKGYWGVARDVTAVRAAREALLSTETRYQELFVRIPTPLVLHRQGRVIDANPAAVAFFGYDNLASMVGVDLLKHYEAPESRERATARAEQLLGMEEGAALAPVLYQLQVRGRAMTVQATGVRVHAQGGPALMSIFLDLTERIAAETAVRQSQALLAHVVATSPDLITLTDMVTGRYAMVNHAFERIIGWSAAETMGRTSVELGVWPDAEARAQFVMQLRESGQVSDLPVTFRNRQGQDVALRVSAARFALDRRDYMVINARDVSAAERDRMERAAILDHAAIGIAVTRDRRFVLANPHFERMFGWAAGLLAGQPGAVVWRDAADYDEVGRLLGPRLIAGEAVELERPVQRHDGSSFLAKIHACAIDPARPREGGTVWIVEDVTERRAFEKALARARDDAEAANRAKSAFLANTSHELRTPLNGMIGLARMAADPAAPELQRRQYLEQITDSAQALAAVISDILDLSKIEAGKLEIEAAQFDLAELLRGLARTYRALAQPRGLWLRLELDDTLEGVVVGDALRVRQIIGNFLSNALKFTGEGGVQLRAGRLPSGLARIEVVDSGPGIPQAVQSQLFQPFVQGDQSTTRRHGGTGLGLSICRELAELMGGSVGVESEEGRGACFWLVLPLPPGVPAAAAPAPAQGSLEGLRVLMVEDNAVNMLIATAMLQGWGVQVLQAADGREAVAVAQRAFEQGEGPDAVLMDVQMPEMSGHEATRAMRREPWGQTLPIVALTAAALVSEREEALASGMDDFLTKPIDPERLRSVLLQRCRRER